MPRLLHGEVIRRRDVGIGANTAVARAMEAQADSATLQPALNEALAAIQHPFRYMFPALQSDPGNVLVESTDTPGHLIALGLSMADVNPQEPVGDSDVPAIYTYFGQFVDHDITLEAVDDPVVADIFSPMLAPLDQATIEANLKNLRTATLDLDSVYDCPAPTAGDKMVLGRVSDANQGEPDPPPPDCIPLCRPARAAGDDRNDVPRLPPDPDNFTVDRAANIGDPRNDENLIIAQLHVAFLRAHNAIVDMGNDFASARKIVRQHYQHIVLHDFLKKRVANEAIVEAMLPAGSEHFRPAAGALFMPLEFAAAGYRFGHTMVRNEYNFNLNFHPTTFDLLFTFTALSGELFGFPSLPDNWIIEWGNITDLGGSFDKARQIDTTLAEPAMFMLQNEKGQVFGSPGDEANSPVNKARLAVRNLLRGYLLRLPTGQAVAQALGITPLTPNEIKAVATGVGQAQSTALEEGGFAERTPLWYYILAEAKAKGGGTRLGPVGSTLVAAVLIELVRQSEDSILTDAAWSGPTLPTLPDTPAGQFTLRDLLGVAGVLGEAAITCQYTVVAGDSLSGIAQKLYGAQDQWPRIFQANQDQISDPNQIFPGQVLRIPATAQHTVIAGDSLSGIAQQFYGDFSLWPRIFEANRDQISDPDQIFSGQLLCIP